MSSLLSSLLSAPFEIGPITLTAEDVEALAADGTRILVIVVASYVLLRVIRAALRRTVRNVRDPERGLVDEVRKRTHPGRSRDPIQHARRIRRTEAMSSVLQSIATLVVWTLALFSILSTVGINLGPYLAGLGIVGVALGFGAQDLVKDFISGMFMLLEDQYGVGDVVDAGEATGTVEGITLRTTRIRSVDGTLWFVPNGEIRRLGNMSQDWARALLDIGVAYGTDTDVAARLILDVAQGMAEEEDFRPKFLAEPELWGVERLGADAIDIRLVIKTTPGDQWGVSRELRRRIKQTFDAEGIEIPFPQRTIWVRNEGGTLADTDGTAGREDRDDDVPADQATP